MVEKQLRDAGIEYFHARHSALDSYYDLHNPYHQYIYARGDLITLSTILEDPEFPGIQGWDLAVGGTAYTHNDPGSQEQPRVYIRCLDDENEFPTENPQIYSFLYDPVRDRYLDKRGVYQLLRERRIEETGDPAATAVLIARYGFTTGDSAGTWAKVLAGESSDYTMRIPSMLTALSLEEQRLVLGDILTGDNSAAALDYLLDCGFISEYWPELPAMDLTEHSKEHHPEGNVWRHTLETLQYRKTKDLRLALALLLHDVGKPLSSRSEENEFDRHAEIGAQAAARFLRRLGYSDELVNDVRFLIRYHMFPGAISRLPIHRSAPIMSRELFPMLLELYRCDLSSTFRGPEGYYRACRTYRSFLKNRANPFRDTEGKKLLRLYVE